MLVEFIKRGKKITSQAWLFFLDLIFPIECLGCGREGGWLCSACFKKVNLKSKQYCLGCKRENQFGEFCPNCQNHYHLNGVWIASLYEDRLISQAIKSLKYHFVSSLAEDLGKLLILFVNNLINQNRVLRPGLDKGVDWREFDRAKNAPSAILDFKADLIIPVPLAKKRLRWRGFNQAEVLGKIFAREYDLEINTGGLIRVKHKKPQAKLDEISRQLNIKDCFAWRGGSLSKRNIILIDDVVTTGATLNECAKVLKVNGAGEVWGLVVAKG
jgi:ComF family protein